MGFLLIKDANIITEFKLIVYKIYGDISSDMGVLMSIMTICST